MASKGNSDMGRSTDTGTAGDSGTTEGVGTAGGAGTAAATSGTAAAGGTGTTGGAVAPDDATLTNPSRAFGGVPQGIFIATALSMAIILAGALVGQGIRNSRSYDRFVTVKGLAERDVTADRAVWPITFVATDDSLEAAQRAIESDTVTVRTFLADQGIADESVEVQDLAVTDQLAQTYRSGPIDSRYIIQQTLLVRTDDVEAVRTATQSIGELLAEGVVLGGQGYRPAPSYQYTGLNDIKTEMIAEATAAARGSADQFAQDSGSSLGGIRRANQGVFQILAADGVDTLPESTQVQKTVRAVVTLEYYLVDE
ncbi:MAG: SIMPL domain-containing protein [Alkalispirochaeta sp.]